MLTRYSIKGVSLAEVSHVGAQNVREAKRTGIIFADLTDEQANKLRTLGATVVKVSDVKTAVVPPVPIVPPPLEAGAVLTPSEVIRLTGLEQLRQVFSPPLSGTGFNLAIVDTGIRETHQSIGGRVVYAKNYTSDPMQDGFDHGTGTCSIALSVAPQCNILNMKVLDNRGQGTEEEVVFALDDIIAMHDDGSEFAPHVVNLSLGMPDDGNPDNVLRVACRAAIERNIWVIAAAGNSGPGIGTIMCPACERYVMAVGSATYLSERRSFMVSNFSSRGPTLEGVIKPDILMFGEGIEMASAVGDTAVTYKSGTSFAAPFVSGAVILFLEGWLAKYSNWQQYVEQFLTQVPASEFVSIMPKQDEIIDRYLKYIAIKPQGVSTDKDNEYGYGLPFGPLIMKTLGFGAAIDLSSVFMAMMSLMVMMPLVKVMD